MNKALHPFIAASVLFVQIQAAAQSSIIFQNDFSGTNNPGVSRITYKDNAFAVLWSVAPSLESESGNQYARYDITIPSLPSNPGARWYGGYSARVGYMTALPLQWELSFDIFLTAIEPVRVTFEFDQGELMSPTMSCWIQPSQVGWERIAINQNADFVWSQAPSTPVTGTQLRVSLASHDPDGNPLTISQIGTYHFFLDNVMVQSVPEPGTLGFWGMAAALYVGTRRYRTSVCTKPRKGAAIAPQKSLAHGQKTISEFWNDVV